MNDEIDNIDTLLNQLSAGYPPKIPNITPEAAAPTEDELSNFILKKSSALIDLSLDSVKELKDYITQGQNPDEIAALAALITSTTGALESLNKLNILRKKHEMTKEIKALDFSNKKEMVKALPASSPTNTITNNTQVIVASREEIIKQMLGLEEPEEKIIRGREFIPTEVEIMDK